MFATILMIFFHFIGEQVFRHEKWFQMRSYNAEYILKHSLIYSLVVAIPFCFTVVYNVRDIYVFIQRLCIFLFTTTIFKVVIEFILVDYLQSLKDSQKLGKNIPNFGYNTVIILEYTIKLIFLYMLWQVLIR
jgi:hypothetical protein